MAPPVSSPTPACHEPVWAEYPNGLSSNFTYDDRTRLTDLSLTKG